MEIGDKVKLQNLDEKFKINMIDELKGRIPKSKLFKYFTTRLPLDQFTDDELYYFAKALNKVKKYNFKLEDYFTEKEITIFETNPLITETEEENINKIIIENIYEGINDHTWLCPKFPAKKLVNAIFNGNVEYDFRVQRNSKKRRTKSGNFMETISTNEESVKQIKEKIINGNFEPDAITWNILQNGNEDYEYDAINHKMVIYCSDQTLNQLLDGWHRSKAYFIAYQEDPNLEAYVELRIKTFDISQAFDYMNQKSKATPYSALEKKSFKAENEYLIAKELSSKGTPSTNLLYGKIGREADDLKLDKIMIEEYIASTISKYFKLENNNQREIRLISNHLIKFYNEILSIYKNDFENKETKNYITTPSILTAMIVVAADIYNNKIQDWEDKLDQFLSTIDWTNEEWDNFKNSTMAVSKRNNLEDKIYRRWQLQNNSDEVVR